MIKCKFGEELRITGHVTVIAAEMEEIMRNVRNTLCNDLGKDHGMDLYEEIIKTAYMDEEERNAYTESEIKKAEADNPELCKSQRVFVDAMMKMLFGDTDSPCSAEEE